MARSVILLVLMVSVGLAITVPSPLEKPYTLSKENLEYQRKFMLLFSHTHEPLFYQEHKDIAHTWLLIENTEKYSNITAVNLSYDIIKHKWMLPMGVPFSVLEPHHLWQAVTFYNLLFSAKTLDTFYKTAVYLKAHINEYMFVYILTMAVYHRQDTQGLVVPPLYEVFPSFFNNGEVMTTAQRINTHGTYAVEHYPSTYIWDNDVVIRRNSTLWPYSNKDSPVAYYTHDFSLNNYYYNMHVMYPPWLKSKTVDSDLNRSGVWLWFFHKEFVSRYYLERLSNGLGEIPELDFNIVEDGYNSGLLYHSGIPFPVRPEHFQLQQPEFNEKIQQIADYERRIRDAIDSGYYVTPTGEHINIRTPEAIDVLGRLIEGGVDSPNNAYYKDFISLWKKLLGNSNIHSTQHWKGISLVVPSALEHYQTAHRDPAFYMISKKVLNLFTQWQKHLPPYSRQEIELPGVEIQKVEVDKLVTYFEHTYLNITNHLHLSEYERQHSTETHKVLVEHNRLNHKPFSIRVHVKCEKPKNAAVRFWIGPKYDSTGKEIPLEANTVNFFQLTLFSYNLKEGDNVISHSSNDIPYLINDYTPSHKIYNNIVNALENHEPYVYSRERPDGWPRRLILPKGRVGGMPFKLIVHISENHTQNNDTNFNPQFATARQLAHHYASACPGFPLDRPIQEWWFTDIKNFWLQDVVIYHKPTPEVVVDHL